MTSSGRSQQEERDAPNAGSSSPGSGEGASSALQHMKRRQQQQQQQQPRNDLIHDSDGQASEGEHGH
jgi:hypothetical protein